MNLALDEEGLHGYGLDIGRLRQEQIAHKLLSDDLMTRSMRLASAASDAQMAGTILPATSNSG